MYNNNVYNNVRQNKERSLRATVQGLVASFVRSLRNPKKGKTSLTQHQGVHYRVSGVGIWKFGT